MKVTYDTHCSWPGCAECLPSRMPVCGLCGVRFVDDDRALWVPDELDLYGLEVLVHWCCLSPLERLARLFASTVTPMGLA